MSSLWEFLRPLLGPLYHAMMTVPITLVSIAPHQWPDLLDALQDDLLLSKSLAHPSLRKSMRVVRAANFTLRDRDHAKSLTPRPLQASADACATATEAGLGGILRVNGEVVAWFAFTIEHAEAQQFFPWISDFNAETYQCLGTAGPIFFGLLLASLF